MKKIVLASHNAGKIKEFGACLAPLGVHLISAAELHIPEPEETGLTFIENAILKARHAALHSGLPALADDSGLAVAALQGAPGIYSARYAGKHASSHDNIQKLLAAMKDVPDDHRQAEFHCVLAFMTHPNDPTPIVCDGRWEGTLLRAPRGADGFGYDPVFFIPSLHQTAAELSLAEKSAISHRGKATAQLIAHLLEKI